MNFLKKVVVFILLIAGTIATFQFVTAAKPAQAAVTGPTASMQVLPRRGAQDTKFIFDASASRDSRGGTSLQYRFTPDFSRVEFSSWQGATFSYVYGNETPLGQRQAIVEVRDNTDGLTDRASVNVFLDEAENIQSGSFEVDPHEGTLETPFTFYATLSDINESQENQVRWDFEGDGTWNTGFTATRLAIHHFPKFGFYTPKAQMRTPSGTIVDIPQILPDDPLNKDPHDLRIHVTDAELPLARLAASTLSGRAGATEFRFDASDSWDKTDKTKLIYQFDFGDGILTNPSKEPVMRHVFATPGKYKVTVIVKDTDGNSDQTSVVVTVGDYEHKPAVEIDIYQPSGVNSGTGGTTGSEYRFTARVRDFEDNASQLKVRWDFDENEDNGWDTTYSVEKVARHIYYTPGKKVVKVEVIDSTGRTTAASREVLIVQNTPPRIEIKVWPLEGTVGTIFTLDIVKVEDDQFQTGQVQNRVDKQGDGVFENTFTSQRHFTIKYDKAGNYKVVVQARDPQGLLAEKSVSIKVVNSTPPQAQLEVNPGGGTYSTNFLFSAANSSDRENSLNQLQFGWDYDYQGKNDISKNTGFINASQQRLTFNKPGRHQVLVEVRDLDGMTASALASIDIHWASPYLETLRQRNVMNGYNGDMQPDRPITRAEFLKVVLAERNIATYGMKYQGTFKDVKSSDWFWPVVEKAAQLGYAKGFTDGGFHPNATITRAESASLLMKIYGLKFTSLRGSAFGDVKTSDWFYRPVHAAFQAGVASGYSDGTFRPYNQLTRGEAAKLIVQASKVVVIARP